MEQRCQDSSAKQLEGATKATKTNPPAPLQDQSRCLVRLDAEGPKNENKHQGLLTIRQRMQAACDKRREICEARQPSSRKRQAASSARRARRRPVPGLPGCVFLNSDDDPRNSSSEEDLAPALASISEESPGESFRQWEQRQNFPPGVPRPSWPLSDYLVDPPGPSWTPPVAVPAKAPPPGLPGTTMPPPSKAPPSRAISRGSLPAFKAPPPGSGPAWFWSAHRPVNLDH